MPRGHSAAGGEEVKSVLHQGRTLEAGRGRGQLEAVLPLPVGQQVMQDPELQVN